MNSNISGLRPVNHEIAEFQAHDIKRRFHDFGHDIPLWLAREAVSAVYGYRDWADMEADHLAFDPDSVVASSVEHWADVESVLEDGAAYQILNLLKKELEANPVWDQVHLGHSTAFLFALTSAMVELRDRGDIKITPETIRQFLPLPKFNDLVFQYLSTLPPLSIRRPIYAFAKKWRYFETGTTTKKAKANHKIMEDMVRAATYSLESKPKSQPIML